jgi:hypothetical protein
MVLLLTYNIPLVDKLGAKCYIQSSRQVMNGNRKNGTDLSLQFGLRGLAGDGALNKTIGVRLRCEDGRIFAKILDTLVP